MVLDSVIAVAAVNIVAYASLVAGLVQLRRRSSLKFESSQAVFGLLEAKLRKTFPDLPYGFTLREGVSRAKGLGLDLRWELIEEDLAMYEAYRYGGAKAPRPPLPEMMKLISALRRHR